MRWNMRYAAHLGFRSLETPLFLASAGSADPLAQIDFGASLGLAAIQDPWFATRPRPVQDAMAAALSERGLAAGCVVCGTPATIRTPRWNRSGNRARADLESDLRGAMDAARRLGAKQIVVLTGLDPEAPRERQVDALIANLRWTGEIANAEGLVLCLEPTNARSLPGMLLGHFGEGCEIARASGHRSVRMVFDAAHVQSMDGDLLGHMERAWDQIEIVQIANHPGRSEPEVGEINMATVLTKVRALGYRGLVELEHLWSSPGARMERRGIDWLRDLDTTLA
jgi:hydroxypyruvate isomerase